MSIKIPFVASIIGKAGSGKSTLIKSLISDIQDQDFYERFEIVLVCSKTKFNQAYDWVPSQWVHGGYNERAIKNLLKLQAGVIAQGYKPLPVCIIFDDCLKASAYQSEFFSDLIANRRHYNLSVIFSSQYLNRQVPTLLRENSDLIYIFKQFSENSLSGCFSAFGSLYMGRPAFNEKMKQLGDNKYLEIDTRNNTYRITKCPLPDEPEVEYFAELPLEVLQKR